MLSANTAAPYHARTTQRVLAAIPQLHENSMWEADNCVGTEVKQHGNGHIAKMGQRCASQPYAKVGSHTAPW